MQQWLGQMRWIGEPVPSGDFPSYQDQKPLPPAVAKDEIQYKPWINPTVNQAAVLTEEQKQAISTEHAVERALSPTEKILLASVIISAIGLLYSIFGRRR